MVEMDWVDQVEAVALEMETVAEVAVEVYL
jgi:hypothetical protein